jgi:hypothetical protein
MYELVMISAVVPSTFVAFELIMALLGISTECISGKADHVHRSTALEGVSANVFSTNTDQPVEVVSIAVQTAPCRRITHVKLLATTRNVLLVDSYCQVNNLCLGFQCNKDQSINVCLGFQCDKLVPTYIENKYINVCFGFKAARSPGTPLPTGSC